MNSRTAQAYKKEWSGMPARFFEPLTFGELPVGAKFISLPRPGDNHGHGGFRREHRVFVKTKDAVEKTASGRRYGVPTGEAVPLDGDGASTCPHSMAVIRLSL